MPSGHLRKRTAKKNTWEIILELGVDPLTGQRIRHTETFRGPERAAKARMNELLGEIAKGTYVKPTKVTLKEHLEDWLQNYSQPNVSPKTYNLHELLIRRHIIPALGHLRLTHLEPKHLQQFYTAKLQGGRVDGRPGGLSPQTVIHCHAIIRQALGQAVRWGLIARNVAELVDRPRLVKRPFQALDSQQVAHLLAIASTTSFYGIILAAVYTGLRRGELLGLRWQDVDFAAGTAQIRQTIQRVGGQGLLIGEPKTAKSRRAVHLTSSVLEVMAQIREQQTRNQNILGEAYEEHGLVFCNGNGRPLSPEGVDGAFRRIAKQAGFPSLRFHDLRHTHATLLLQQGVHPKVVQERLGHASVTLTLDTYSHVLPLLHRQAADELEQLLGRQKDDKGGENEENIKH